MILANGRGSHILFQLTFPLQRHSEAGPQMGVFTR